MESRGRGRGGAEGGEAEEGSADDILVGYGECTVRPSSNDFVVGWMVNLF